MVVRKGKVIIDTNLPMQALDFRKYDVFDWIDNVNEDIYIYIEVVNEFRVESERKSILGIIKDRDWTLFDHNDEKSLSCELNSLYWEYVNGIHQGFESLKKKKEAQGIIPKTSNNIGEIHCIALAQLISGNIISSNDYEIREIILDENIRIYSADLDEEVLIEQDTIEDFCFYCVQGEIVKPSAVIQFFKVCHSSDDRMKLEEKVVLLKSRIRESLEAKSITD